MHLSRILNIWFIGLYAKTLNVPILLVGFFVVGFEAIAHLRTPPSTDTGIQPVYGHGDAARPLLATSWHG